METSYIIVVDLLTTSILRAVDSLIKDGTFPNLGVIVLTRDKSHSQRKIIRYQPGFSVQVIGCRFSNDREILSAIRPYEEHIAGIVCRQDKYIQDMRKLVPMLPSYVHAPTRESLTAATNKYLMREAFSKFAPGMTPKHIKVLEPSKKAVSEIEGQLSYPVIVKPASLASSLLIQSCQNRDELETALRKVFTLIPDVYKKEERLDKPEVIVEEYLEGNFYSIDAYVLTSSEVYFCPPVSYLPAKQIGVDDFFLYKRTTPTLLSDSQIKEANKITKQSINALGLEYSSAHVELVLTKNGWQIIELGPRLGRFRESMYRLSYGIDHSLNDIKVRLGLKPVINYSPSQYCAAYSIYPSREGKLLSIRGIDEITSSPACKWRHVSDSIGGPVLFAKHGGHALAEFIVTAPSISQLEDLTKHIKKDVYAEVE